jgi:transglutaminase-like putative cysteine protease
VLLTALARAAGIPARVVAGLVYQDGDFFYHAWSELWLDGWLSADAVFAQMPADATHVKLLEGGPERHAQLARLMGRLSFATVEEGS